jgi:hypothetical protein
MKTSGDRTLGAANSNEDPVVGKTQGWATIWQVYSRRKRVVASGEKVS